MRESSPVSPTTIKHEHRHRRGSKDGPAVEEISPDDMGYDGDIEVVYPDQYEEPESDSEKSPVCAQRLLPDPDDELINRMRRLKWNPQNGGSSNRNESSRGRKRMSVEMEDHWHQATKKTDIEVVDLDGHGHSERSAKRRKAKDTKPIPLRRLSSEPKPQSTHPWRSDSSDRTEGRRTPAAESITSTSTSELPINEDREAMDVD